MAVSVSLTWYSSWTPPKGLKSYLYLSTLMWAQSKLSAALRLASPVDSNTVIPLDCIRIAEDVGYVVGEEERCLETMGRTGSNSRADGSSQARI